MRDDATKIAQVASVGLASVALAMSANAALFREQEVGPKNFSLKKRPFQLLDPDYQRKMRVIAAYLLAQLGGNSSPSADDITSILGSVGIEAEEDRLDLFLKEMKGKDIHEVLAIGREKLSAVPSGGGGAVAAGGAAPAGGAAAGGGAAEEKKEEAKKEESEEEESDEDMGFSLFD
eukprot:TRINITY_DN656_c0_g1_i1.p2 TRINITY_DN656_c0_g1~~TRINITY_DN656_c0_g1_i1.p2  ORF type:complete len:176 (-),score=46.51 TRINITY_DN656_c0_g1_i1:213-740(-)